MKTSETAVCIEGCLDWVIYEELPNVDAGGPVHNGETAADESCFTEVARFRVCPREGVHGISIPLGAWHSVEVYEPGAIFEAKDGAYGKSGAGPRCARWRVLLIPLFVPKRRPGEENDYGCMNTRNNPLGAYFEGAFRAASASCFIGGRISEQQIDFVKEVVSRFREAEIDHLSFPDSDREEMKRQWKLWLDATTRGIKDELRGEGKLM